MQDIHFPLFEYGIGKSSNPDDNNWLTCKVKDKVFHGHGGPDKLEEIIKCFLDWNDKSSK